jgi:hypothetical protein
MLQGFWGGVILSVVNQTIVFLVLGGLAGAIVAVQKLLAWRDRHAPKSPPRPVGAPPARRTPPGVIPPRGQARVAAIMGAVHAFAGAAPGTLRIVGVTRIGADSLWKATGRMEAMGMEIGNNDRLQ